MSSSDSTLTYKWETGGTLLSSTRFHTISNVAKSDGKAYTCTVSNSNSDSSSKDFSLTVNGMFASFLLKK